AQQELEEKGQNPLDLDAPQWVDYPSSNLINWITKNPNDAQLVLQNPEQKDFFIFSAWKELFQSKNVLQFLSLQDKLSQKMQIDIQNKDSLAKLEILLRQSSIKDLTKELDKPHNKSIRNDFLEALNISKSTPHLDLIQTLEKQYNSSGTGLTDNVISNPEEFVRLLVDSA
ncbi:MAG: hypothetical protein CL916_01580, partial [Deltaproteobacteria bacterium]|nr:hypothetical protein [Deltaproteobacteria bacterium]